MRRAAQLRLARISQRVFFFIFFFILWQVTIFAIIVALAAPGCPPGQCDRWFSLTLGE
jgi:hypothetical protein